MNEDKFLAAQAQEIRRMADSGHGSKDIQSKLKVKKNRLIEILGLNYTERNRTKILDTIRYNEMKLKEHRKKKEVIVLDTSFLISSKLKDIEDFLLSHDNVIIPGPTISELHTNSNDENINYSSRRILTILLELNVKVEIADSSIMLDPTWVKNNDYYILTVCAKLVSQGYIVKILSFDKEMILKARGLGVEVFTMDFPQENVKHCNSYLLRQEKQEPSIATDESLEALKNKFDIKSHDKQEKASKDEIKASVYRFNKPKASETIQLNENIPEICNNDGKLRLIDTSSTDLLMGIIKTVISSNGKPKDLFSNEESPYYEIDDSDEIVIFTKQSDLTVEMKVGNVDENLNFVESNILTLKEGGMKRVSKKYHYIIKTAFQRLLKINLKKIS